MGGVRTKFSVQLWSQAEQYKEYKEYMEYEENFKFMKFCSEEEKGILRE